MVYDSISLLLTSITLYGTGIAFAIIGLVLAISRSISKNSDTWALTFSAFAWLIAMMIPNVPFSAIIFVLGALAITIAYTPILIKIDDSNIIVLAIFALVINSLLVFGTGAHLGSNLWLEQPDIIDNEIQTQLGNQTGLFDSFFNTAGLCRPDEPGCTVTFLSGVYDSVIFDVFAGIIDFAGIIGKAFKLIAVTLLAPFAITTLIKDYVPNVIAYQLIAIYVSLWNFAILYKTIMFAINKRGSK